jgi:proteasome lid subunit RPN8/RPN11
MTLTTYANPLTAAQQQAIRAHAEAAFPLETCGFILTDGSVVECANTSNEPDTFIISAAETAQYLDDAIASWHSHANYARFSPADIRACKTLNLPYVVWDCGSSQCFWLDPRQDAGLVGRPWNYGVYDCYSAVRDWYYQQQGLVMGDYPREYEGEWCQRGFTHFEDNFATEGFSRIAPTEPLQRGDVILFRIRNDVTCNHVAVVEDPAANMLYQHLVDRLSGLSAYSGYFRENAYMVVRRSA